MKEKYISTPSCDMWIENDILHCNYKKGLVVTLPIAKQIIRDRNLLTEGKPYPGLTDICGVKGVEESAKDYLTSKQAAGNITAMAVVYASPIEKMISTFYKDVNIPLMPSRLFTNREQALIWLEMFKKHNQS